MAINTLPNTRFGLYGEHNGRWLKVEPDENFSLDTGATIQVHENFGPALTPSRDNAPSPCIKIEPDSMINLAEDIFSDSFTMV